MRYYYANSSIIRLSLVFYSSYYYINPNPSTNFFITLLSLVLTHYSAILFSTKDVL